MLAALLTLNKNQLADFHILHILLGSGPQDFDSRPLGLVDQIPVCAGAKCRANQHAGYCDQRENHHEIGTFHLLVCMACRCYRCSVTTSLSAKSLKTNRISLAENAK